MTNFRNLLTCPGGLIGKCGVSIVAAICLLPAGVNGQGGDLPAEKSLVTAVSGNQLADAAGRTQASAVAPSVVQRTMEGGQRAPVFAKPAMADKSPQSPTASPTHEPGNILIVQIDKDEFIVFIQIASLSIWVGKYEVTNAQYNQFDRAHSPKKYYDHFINLSDQPVVQVSWEDANNYCGWLNRHCRRQLPAGCEFRLPSEKEWNAFALCGREKKYPWGDQWPPPDSYNYKGQEGASILYVLFQNEKFIRTHNDGFITAAPVGKSGANEWGLYGVGGNVWEWCQDWFDETKTTRVLKGAAWNNSEQTFLTVSNRSSAMPEKSNVMIGFRVVIAPQRK